MVKRNKRRRTDETTLKSTDASGDILWKYSSEDPTENLTKLIQYVGAYATATVDKASEIKALLKQRESRIQELEHMLDTEKVKSTEKIK